MLVEEGSGCLGAAFLSLDTVRAGRCISSRRVLLRDDDCDRFCLIPCGRSPIIDQPRYAATGTNGAYLGLLATSVGAQASGCFDLLGLGPYRLEEEG
jgi:hypothetical protein